LSRVRTLVATEFLMLLGLLAYVGAVFVAEEALGLNSPLKLAAPALLALALFPALLWLGYFYAQDRLELRPTHHLLGLLVAGAFVAGPVAAFVVEHALDRSGAEGNLSLFAPERWIGAVLVIGIAQETCKYASVRYTLYTSPDFDSPIEGIIYTTVAGLGFAAFDSYSFLRAHDTGILLSAAAAHTVIVTLAHASIAAVTGYALARAKFRAMTPFARGSTLLAGLLSASLLNGAFFLLVEGLSSQGLSPSTWRGLLAAFGFATLVLLVVSLLMRKLAVSLSSVQSASASSPHADVPAAEGSAT
jgi:RsiW-degrading membrane proteinase PrsW (M82 family)